MITLQTIKVISKAKVVMMMILSAWVGMYLAPKQTPLWQLATIGGTLGISLAASGAAALNHLFDQQFDALMSRTQHRPLVKNTITKREIYQFISICLTLSMICLYLTTNLLAMWLTMATTIGYAVIYTKILKPATPQNIVIGGLSGALPPLLGWTCMTGSIQAEPLILVAIIFTWTPPHFWALALWKKEDYKKISIPVLPITHSSTYTKKMIILYTCLTLIMSLIPYCLQMFQLFYLISSLILGGYFMYLSIRLYNDRITGQTLFHFSNKYLLLLFLAMILDPLILINI